MRQQGRADAVLIVGAGQGGLQVAASLRERGWTGPVSIIGDEPHLPYQRPPLSKAYLQAGGGHAAVALRPPAFYAEHEIEIVVGRRAVCIDRENGRVRLDDGQERPYDHLVLATGASARTLPLPALQGVFTLRSLGDAEALRPALASPGAMVLIGGGFVGLEIAAAAAKAGRCVTVIETAPRLLARAVAPPMSEHVMACHRAHGVQVLTGQTVRTLHGRQGKVCAVELDDGQRIEADAVVLGIGAVPNDGLARDAGLETCNGIRVTGQLQTTLDPRISAVGDCAEFPSIHAGAHRRLESVQNAVDQGRYVSRRLLEGSLPPYGATPWFWTHQHEMTLQIAGLGGAGDRCMLNGDPASGRFSVLRFGEDGRLRCAESVNRPADHMATRKLLDSGCLPSFDEASRCGFTLPAFLKGS